MRVYLVLVLAALAVAGRAEDVVRFNIERFAVEGNSVLSDEVLQSVLRPYTGQGRDFADVQKALEALEARYRESGFGAMQVYLPEQELKLGVVTLKVVETKLGQVRIEGNQYFGQQNIRRALPALREGAVPNTAQIARQLRLANESPARRLVVSMQGTDDPKLVDALVKVSEDKVWRVFAQLDNSGDKETGKTRLGVGWQHGALYGLDHAINFQFTTSPDRNSHNVRVVGLGYRLPLYGLGDSVSVFGGYSNVSSAALQGLFNVTGKGTLAGVRYIKNLPTLGEYRQQLLLGYDWRRFDSNSRFAGGDPFARNDYTLRPLSLAYAVQHTLPQAAYELNVSWVRNWTNTDYPLATASGRVGARARYHLGRATLNSQFALPADWSMRAVLNSQYSGDALAPGEQFGIGGSNSVRAYTERTLAGDKGLSWVLELQSADLAPAFSLPLSNLRLLWFYDWGRVQRNELQAGDLSQETLESLGVGLRVGLGKSASVKVDLASALRNAANQHRGDAMVHASAVMSY